MKYAQLGSVSSGTMRNVDLLVAFAGELSYQMKKNLDCLDRWQIKRFKSMLDEAHMMPDDDEFMSELVYEFFEALDQFSPPGACFGAHPGDGADYGYWQLEDEPTSTETCT